MLRKRKGSDANESAYCDRTMMMLAQRWLAFYFIRTGFWPSYCQISTNLDKILIHLLLYGIHLWADLDRDRHVGGSRPNQNDYAFVILVTHSKSYIETTDRRDFGGKPSKWR